MLLEIKENIGGSELCWWYAGTLWLKRIKVVGLFICGDSNCGVMMRYILIENYLLYLLVTGCCLRKSRKPLFPLLSVSWQQVSCNLHVEWGRNTAACHLNDSLRGMYSVYIYHCYFSKMTQLIIHWRESLESV